MFLLGFSRTHKACSADGLLIWPISSNAGMQYPSLTGRDKDSLFRPIAAGGQRGVRSKWLRRWITLISAG